MTFLHSSLLGGAEQIFILAFKKKTLIEQNGESFLTGKKGC